MKMFTSTRKAILYILWGLLAILCLGILVSIRTELFVHQEALSRFQIVLYALPFFLFGAVHLFLMYESWFHSGKTGIFTSFKRGFLWLLATFYVVTLLGFIGYFVVSK